VKIEATSIDDLDRPTMVSVLNEAVPATELQSSIYGRNCAVAVTGELRPPGGHDREMIAYQQDPILEIVQIVGLYDDVGKSVYTTDPSTSKGGSGIAPRWGCSRRYRNCRSRALHLR
jgi:hypothetical protein